LYYHQNHSKTINYLRKGGGAKEEDASVKAMTQASIMAVLLMVIHRVTQMYRMTVLTCANDHCHEDYDNNSY